MNTIQEFRQKWTKKYKNSKIDRKDFYYKYLDEIVKDMDNLIFLNLCENFVNVKDVNIGDTNNKTRTRTSNCSRKI